MMKDDILLQTTLSQGFIQAVDAKTNTYNEVPDDLKTHLDIKF